MSILAAAALQKRFGDRVVFRDVTFRVARGERVGIVGPNGCGKSTLLRLVSGALDRDAGSLALARGTRIGFLEQELLRPAEGRVEEYLVAARARLDALEAELRALEPRLDETESLERYAEVAAAFEHAGGHTFEGQVSRVLGGLGFAELDRRRPLQTLSGGERTRLGLARLLLEDPDLLLLDEPTNHLDLAALEWLERFLVERDATALVASHDRYFLDRATRRTLAFVDGTVRAYRGSYSSFARQRQDEVQRQSRVHERQRAEVARQEAFIAKERAGQRAKSARGRQKQLARLELVSAPASAAERPWDLPALPLGSATVLETTPLDVGFDRSAPLLRAPALRLGRGARAAIVGPNGAGKTTLLRTLLGDLRALGGYVRSAPGVRVAAYAQSQSWADERGDVLEAFRATSGWSEQKARDVLARFLFRGEDVFRELAALSGGERSRLALARLAARPANLLALDEPTGHLDLPSREALEDLLTGYEGTIIFVSHDRYFIDRLATEVWLLERGELRRYEGNYSAMQATRAESSGRDEVGVESRPRGPRRERAAGERRPGRRGRSGALPKPEGEPQPLREGRGHGRAAARSRRVSLDELEARIAALERQMAALAGRVTEVAQAGNYLEARRAGEEYAELERALQALYAEADVAHE